MTTWHKVGVACLIAITLLLAGNFVVLLNILDRMPPTYGELEDVEANGVTTVLRRAPIVWSRIPNPLPVEVTNAQPDMRGSSN